MKTRARAADAPQRAASILLAAVLCFTATLALPSWAPAQPQESNAPQPGNELGPPAPDQEIADVIDHLKGSWRSDNHRLRAAPVALPGAPQAMYVELVRNGAELRPRASEVWVFFRKHGNVAARVLHAPAGSPLDKRLIGCWASPNLMPRISPRQFEPVADLVMQPNEGSIATLSTEAPAPLYKDRAIETTYTVSVNGDSLTWRQRGYDAEGEIVWGEDAIELERYEEGTIVHDLGYGILAVDLRSEGEGPAAEEGDTVAAETDAYIATGQRYYSSRQGNRGEDLIELPGKQVSQGWTRGALGMKAGQIRRVIVPPNMARGRFEQNLPQNIYVIYDIEVVSIRDNTPEGSDEVIPWNQR